MSLYNSQTLNPPAGMSTDVSISNLPENRCQYIQGRMPARTGIQRPAPRPKIMPAQTFPFMGQMVWLSSDGQLDTLLTVSDANAGSAGASAGKLRSAYCFQQSGVGYFKYDRTLEHLRTHYALPAWSSGITLAQNSGVTPAGFLTLDSWVQFRTELIFSCNGNLYRYYRTEPTGTENLFTVGLATPSITSLAQSAGGSMTLLGTYEYEITDEDEFGRESSPSAAVSITLTGTNATVTVTRGTLDTSGGSTHWNVYRKNPGGTQFFFVATIVSGTSTYVDAASDTSISTNDVAPSAGENDPPNNATIMTIWKNRLVMNDVTIPADIQVSNAASPTQFSTLPLPTNVADGFTAWVGGKGDNEITGLESLGSMLAIFKRSSMTFLQGDTIENFSLLPIHERGCSNHLGVQRCENEILFPSNDGVYSILYESGYVEKKISVEVDNLFTGFVNIRREDWPRSFGQPQSTESTMSMDGNVTSWYSRNVYYLSFGNKTLGYDMMAPGRGWFDAGFGFVPSAVVYKSQYPLKYTGGTTPATLAVSGPPETVFLTLGDYNSNWFSSLFIKQLYYYTPIDTPFDIDAPMFDGTTVLSWERTRFFDGDGPPTNRTKRAKRFIVWGDTSAKPGQRIGTLTVYADDQMVGVYPIRAWTRIEERRALFEQDMPNSMTGQELWVQMDWTYPDVTTENRAMRYIFLT
jgi:hypothetical protein